ncbi:glycosyltransferase [Bradyrhizobium sp. STM 3557]|uniref:glycosyltransferase n=1 Tax=Bradyrhizobium sp. STM 3557 TaxID=578920 RepID=UPI003890B105
MSPHLLYVGGEDHHLRIPFMLSLRDCGFRVTAAGSGDSIPFGRAGIEFRPFRFDRFVSPFSDWRALKTLSRILRDVSPDLAQAYDTKPCLFLPLAASAADHPAIVRTICGRGWVYSSHSTLALAARPVYRAMYRATVRSTAATVFETDEDRAFFERHRMTGTNGIVIPAGGGGVDVDGFRRALTQSAPADQLRREFDLGTSPIVITVARMTRGKGIPTLLKAAALVHRAQPDVRFLLVGPRESEGPFAVTQAEIDQHAPYVIATGPRSDVPALLKLADVFAFPTAYREGVPRALLEAALAGVPIVSTSMPGCCEVLRDGWNGLLVPPENADRLAVGIINLLRDRKTAEIMARRAEELVAQKFSLRMIVARHIALYAKLLARSSRGRMGELDSTQLTPEDSRC